MRKTVAAILLATTMLTPVKANAEPVSLFVLAVTTTVQAGGGAFVAGLGAIGAGAVGAGLGVALGSALVALSPGLLVLGARFAASALFGREPGRQATTPQSIQSNFNTDVLPRFWLAGEGLVGGGLAFAEAKDNQLTKLIAHADTELVRSLGYYMDDTPILLDDTGAVMSDEYSNGATRPFLIESRHGAINQPAMQTLVDRWPEWTAQHLGAGIADTLLTVQPMNNELRGQLLRGRGNLRLGEPDVLLLGEWGRAYDPRDIAQSVDDPTTWGYSNGNPALIWAAHRMDIERFANSASDIWWDVVAEQADYCDELITDRLNAQIPRYRCFVAINKNDETNITAEDKILATCDGMRVQDSEGRIGLRVGKFYEPTLVLTDEDIGDVETADNRNGETDATHVFAVYTEPAFGYRQTTSAVFTDDSRSATPQMRTQSIELAEIPAHNQAFRVVRASALRLSARKRIALTLGHKGKRSREERILRIDSADSFLNGFWEIASETDLEDGISVAASLIEVSADRWDPDPDEEGIRPNFNVAVEVDNTVENIAQVNMDIQAVVIAGSGVGLEATFQPPADRTPPRPDLIIQIEHRTQGETLFNPFSVKTEDGRGFSIVVPDQSVQECRWRTVTLSGRASEYSEIIEVAAVANNVSPSDLTTANAIGGAGEVTFNITASNDMNSAHSAMLYLNSGAALNRVTDLVGDILLSPGVTTTEIVQTDLSGDIQAFVEPANTSNITGTIVGPIGVTVI